MLKDMKITTTIYNQASMYFFKVNNRNTRTMCETCSMLTKKTQNVIDVGHHSCVFL